MTARGVLTPGCAGLGPGGPEEASSPCSAALSPFLLLRVFLIRPEPSHGCLHCNAIGVLILLVVFYWGEWGRQELGT